MSSWYCKEREREGRSKGIAGKQRISGYRGPSPLLYRPLCDARGLYIVQARPLLPLPLPPLPLPILLPLPLTCAVSMATTRVRAKPSGCFRSSNLTRPVKSFISLPASSRTSITWGGGGLGGEAWEVSKCGGEWGRYELCASGEVVHELGPFSHPLPLTSQPRTDTRPNLSLTLGPSAPPFLAAWCMAETSAPLGGRRVSRNRTSCCLTCEDLGVGG